MLIWLLKRYAHAARLRSRRAVAATSASAVQRSEKSRQAQSIYAANDDLIQLEGRSSQTLRQSAHATSQACGATHVERAAFEDFDVDLSSLCMQLQAQCGGTRLVCSARWAKQEGERLAAFRSKLQSAQLRVIGLLHPAQHRAAGT